jgi:hypothetical protein
MFSEGNAAHLVKHSNSQLQITMAGWCSFNFLKSAPNGHYYLQLAVTLDQITQHCP